MFYLISQTCLILIRMRWAFDITNKPASSGGASAAARLEARTMQMLRDTGRPALHEAPHAGMIQPLARDAPVGA